MSSLRRSVHTATEVRWLPLEHAAPDLLPSGEGSESLMALVLVDPDDKETHIYVFTEEGRRQLLEILTGGIVVPA